MKSLYLIAASALALTVGACGPKTPPVRATLDCPANQGNLTRTSVAPDGKSCTYVTARGGDVTLQLVSVQGGVDATLTAIENNLLADRGKSEEAGAQAAKETDKAIHDHVQKEVDKAVAEASADASEAGVKVEAGKDGKATVVTEDGGETHVNLPGVHITANEDTESANVQVGPININAGDGGATFRMGPRDVRLRGEALNPQRRGIRATFFYHGDDLADGYRFVGYEAGGPKGGPIAVAVVKSRAPDASRIGSDVTKLVRRNGGV